MSVTVGPADTWLTFGENTRNEHRPAWSVRGDLASCSWQLLTCPEPHVL